MRVRSIENPTDHTIACRLGDRDQAWAGWEYLNILPTEATEQEVNDWRKAGLIVNLAQETHQL